MTMRHHTDSKTVMGWLGEWELRHQHWPDHLYRCVHGHDRCALHRGGCCYQDVRALLTCPDCHGEAQPFDGYPSCERCYSLGRVRDNETRPVRDLLPQEAA